MRKPSRLPCKIIAAALLATAVASLGNTAHAASAEPLDIEPEFLAKLAKEKAKATAESRAAANASKKDQRNAQSAADCGAIAIGNVVGNGRIGFGPTDVNVIIVGDVINANNNCR